MIIDASLVLSDSQAITATVPSTNVIDLGAAGAPFGSPVIVEQDIGKGSRIDIVLNVTQGFNNLTSLAVALQVSPDNSAWTEAFTHTYSLADVASPAQLSFPSRIPVGASARYMRLNYAVSGTAPTLGKIFAAIIAGRQSNLH